MKGPAMQFYTDLEVTEILSVQERLDEICVAEGHGALSAQEDCLAQAENGFPLSV